MKDLLNQQWVPLIRKDVDAANRNFKSMSLIKGHIYVGLKKNIVVYDLEMNEVNTILIGCEIGEVYKIIIFRSGDMRGFLLAAESGIFELSESGRYFV